MTKSIVIALFLFCQYGLCQEYHFDKLFKYSEVGRAEIIIMTNTKDSSYFFIHKSYGNNFGGQIVDSKNKFYHRFLIKNSGNSLQFDYENSKSIDKLKIPCYDLNNYYEITKTIKDSVNSSFKIIKYKSLNKRKIVESADFQAKNVDFNTHNIISRFFYHFIYCQKINLPNYYLPTFIVINYNNGKKVKTELIEEKNINTILSINQKKN